jgi:hypothetical protein
LALIPSLSSQDGRCPTSGVGWDSVVLPERQHGRVAMYCVDHRRSAPRTLQQFRPYAAALAPRADAARTAELCKRAAAEFLFSPVVLTLNARFDLVAEECSQQQVWDDVADANQRSGRIGEGASFASSLLSLTSLVGWLAMSVACATMRF